MNGDDLFVLADPRKRRGETAAEAAAPRAKRRRRPWLAGGALLLILLGCLLAEGVMNHDPSYMDLARINRPPDGSYYFGTDALGRDIFSMIWYGGRMSLFIGLAATAAATAIAVVYGCISGIAPEAADDALMRLCEMLLSIPAILLIIFLQGVIGQPNPLSIAVVIGVTSWMKIAKIVRSEVRQIRNSEYIWAARTMNGGFFYILRRHLLPNCVSAIMFMVVMNIGLAIGTESTLSFLGLGLPLDVISWGSMLSQADRALLSNSWWMIVTPGVFLAATLVSITDVGDYIRRRNMKRESNL